MRPVPWSGPQGARSFAEHRRPLAKLHVSPALRLRAWRADRRVEPPDGTGGEQPRPERYAGDCSLSCFTRPVTQLSICPIGASDEGRTCGSGAGAHSKRRPRRQLSNEVCCCALVQSDVVTVSRLLPVYPDQRTVSEPVGMSQGCQSEVRHVLPQRQRCPSLCTTIMWNGTTLGGKR